MNPDELFGDLEPPAAEERLPGSFASDAEAILDAAGFTPASSLLSDSGPGTRPTQPYDILSDQFARVVSLWGDDERFSALSTTPLSLDELPAEAYPTQVNLFDPE